MMASDVVIEWIECRGPHRPAWVATWRLGDTTKTNVISYNKRMSDEKLWRKFIGWTLWGTGIKCERRNVEIRTQVC